MADWYFASFAAWQAAPWTPDGMTAATAWHRGTNHSGASAVDITDLAEGDTLWILDDHNGGTLDGFVQGNLPDNITIRGDYPGRPGRLQVLSFNTCANITVTNLEIRGGSFGCTNVNGLLVDGVTVHDQEKGFVATQESNLDNITIRNSTFYRLTHEGIECFARVGFTRDNWLIEDNEIYDVGYDPSVVNQDFEGIGVQRITNSIIQRNHIHHCQYGINIWESGSGIIHDVLIDDNWIHDITGGPTSWPSRGIFVSGGPDDPDRFYNITITNNLITDIGKEGMRLQAPPDAVGLVAAFNEIGPVNTEILPPNEYLEYEDGWFVHDNIFIGLDLSLALAQGLLHLWEFEETSGTREDMVGDIDLNTITGAPGSTAGKISNAVTTSSGNRLDNAGTVHGFAGKISITVSFWFRATSPGTGEQRLFNFSAGGTANLHVRLLNTTGAISITLRDNAGTAKQVSLSAPVAATWYHVLFTYIQNDALTGYLNGVAGTPAAAANSPVNAGVSSPTTTVGANAGGASAFAGAIDQLAIWERALSADEISSLYNSGAGVALIAVADNGGGMLLLGVGG